MEIIYDYQKMFASEADKHSKLKDDLRKLVDRMGFSSSKHETDPHVGEFTRGFCEATDMWAVELEKLLDGGER